MDSSKHSPTPWFAKRNGFSTVYIESRLRPGVLQEVAACGPTEAGSESQDANAAFIVRAANSHDRLIAALKTLDECYCEIGAPMTSADRLRHRKAIIETRAALAAAGA